MPPVSGMHMVEEALDGFRGQDVRQAEQLLQGTIAIEAVFIDVPVENACLGGQKGSAKALVGKLQMGAGMLLGQHLVSDVFGLVDDVENLAPVIQHRDIQRAPVTDLETNPLAGWPGNVVLGDRHAIRFAGLHHPLQRGPQHTGPELRLPVRVAAEHLENRAAYAVLPSGIGAAKPPFVGRHHDEIGTRRQYQDQVRQRLEQQLKVWILTHCYLHGACHL